MMSFLNRIKISGKIAIGFGAVILLLLAVASVSIIGLQGANSDFKRYRTIALQTNQAGLVQANLLETRLAVKNFVINGSKQAIDIVNQRANNTRNFAKDLLKLVDNPEKKKLAADSDKALATYLDSFQKVTQLQETRNALVLKTLDVVGPQMEKKLTQIMSSAYADTDAESSNNAGLTLRNLLLMRLYATKYLVTNDQASLQRVMQESKAMSAAESKLLAKLQNPKRRQLASELMELHRQYLEAFQKTGEVITTRNEIIAGTLDKIGPAVAKDMEGLKLAVKAEQDEVGPHASKVMEQAVLSAVIVSGIAVLFGLLSAWIIGTGISNPIRRTTEVMARLAEGDNTVDIPGMERSDEIGEMSKAVQVFKDNAIRNEQLVAEREAQKLRSEEEKQAMAKKEEAQKLKAEEDKKAMMHMLADSFTESVGGIIDSVSSASTQLNSTAQSMSGIAEETSSQSAAVSAASEQAAANVQTVAAATEEMSVSITEINQQVSQASDAAKKAVDQVQKTGIQIETLAATADKISNVINMISDIADQTNLLALNATIESARAGEAGKGFAVVANEVKGLAGQTGKATEQIIGQVEEIQAATRQSVTSMEDIGRVIREVEEASSAIAVAMEEQSTVTKEITRNVQQAASGADEVSRNIVGVNQASQEAGAASGQVMSASEELLKQSDFLKTEVEKFVSNIRTG